MKLFKRTNSQAFGHIELVVAIAVIVGIAFIGARALASSHADAITGAAAKNPSSVVSDEPQGVIKSNGTLEDAQTNAKTTYCESVTLCYYYASMAQGGISSSGASVNITQADPTLSSKDYHTLAELAVGDGNYNYVEVGWTVDPGTNGDLLPHLFVFHWVDGAASCYNGCGFVSTSSTYTAGQAITVGATGAFSIQYANSEWQVYYDGTELGYFPESIWSGNFTSSTNIQAFGEVASTSASEPESQMGNGKLGTKSGSASISNLTYINSVGSSTLGYFAESPPKAYKVGRDVALCETGCSMNFGGPGYPETSGPNVNFPAPTSTGLTANINGAAAAIANVGVSSFSVNWGDGSSSILPGITGSVSGVYPVTFQSDHTYATKGKYTITVTATDANGDTNAASEKVSVF